MQIYLNFACNFFLIIVLLAWVWLPTRASRLLHKCREHDTICVLKLALLCRAGLKPMEPMQLHWAPRLGAPRHAACAGCSFLPDTPCTRELQKRLLNLIVSKKLSRLNEWWISSNHRMLSNVLSSNTRTLYLHSIMSHSLWITAQRVPVPRSCIGSRIC